MYENTDKNWLKAFMFFPNPTIQPALTAKCLTGSSNLVIFFKRDLHYDAIIERKALPSKAIKRVISTPSSPEHPRLPQGEEPYTDSRTLKHIFSDMIIQILGQYTDFSDNFTDSRTILQILGH